MKIGYSPAPGQSRTTIVVWEIDDPTKRDDPRYWWNTDEVERLQTLSADLPDLAGKPKGQSLASLQRRAAGDDVELIHPGRAADAETASVRIPLGQWRDADPERTYLIIAHDRAPTGEEQEAMKGKGPPWPNPVEALRKEWLEAEASGHDARSKNARERFDAALAELGFRKARDITPWDPERATELRPGVFVQDERPLRRPS